MSKETEDKKMNKAMQDYFAYCDEIRNHNEAIFNGFSKEELSDFKALLDYCYITEKIEFVDKPEGDKQDEECGSFKNIHVDQWSAGMEGDLYAGFIYAKYKNKWIKIPYSC